MILYATVCHRKLMYVTLCYCVSRVTVYQWVSLYITVCRCMSLYATSLYVTAWLTLCHYISLYITVFHFRHCMSPYFTVFHYMSLCMSLSVYVVCMPFITSWNTRKRWNIEFENKHTNLLLTVVIWTLSSPSGEVDFARTFARIFIETLLVLLWSFWASSLYFRVK